MAKGYRVLARRFKTPIGEIDLIARRGRRIAFVEVKQRPTIALCEASITDETRRRVRRAAGWWMGRRPELGDFEQGFDLVFIANWHWPQHLPNAL
jgi:putative endonuclease